MATSQRLEDIIKTINIELTKKNDIEEQYKKQIHEFLENVKNQLAGANKIIALPSPHTTIPLEQIYFEAARFLVVYVGTCVRGIYLLQVQNEDVSQYQTEALRNTQTIIDHLSKFQDIRTSVSKEPDDNTKAILQLINEHFKDIKTNPDLIRERLQNCNKAEIRKQQIDDCKEVIEKYEAQCNEYHNKVLAQIETLQHSIESNVEGSNKERYRARLHNIRRLLSSNGVNKNTTDCTALNEAYLNYLALLQAQMRELANIEEDVNGAVRVFIRIKPAPAKQSNVTYDIPNSQCIRMVPTVGSEYPPHGPFYDIFDNKKRNTYIFNSLQGLWQQVMSGYHVVLFGYGYSGSGKTYTLLNDDANDYGVAIQAVDMFLRTGITVKIETVKELYLDFTTYNFNNYELTFNGTEITKYETLLANINILDIKKFTELLKQLNLEREQEQRIKVTMNNPQSSRSHLFVKLQVGNSGYLTICDMGGREDPLSIFYDTTIKIDNSSAFTIENTGLNNMKSFHIIINNYNTLKSMLTSHTSYLVKDDKNNEKQLNTEAFVKIGNSIVPKEKLISLMGKKNFPVSALIVKLLQNIFKTYQEGFYINETINHMTWYFKRKQNSDYNITESTDSQNEVYTLVTDRKQYIPDKQSYRYYTSKKYRYNPSNYYVSGKFISTNDKIKMISTLKSLEGTSERPTKFVMFACVREDAYIPEFNEETLKFAQEIASTVAGGKTCN